jgi:hypothetical protein
MIGKAISCRFVTMVFAPLISASLVTTGCNTTTPETSLERNKTLVRHMNDQVWNKGNLDMIGELYAPDFDLVVLHFVSTGTNEGSWRGNPATGRKIRIHEVSILRIEDGRIAEQWLMPDIFSMQQQLARANDE